MESEWVGSGSGPCPRHQICCLPCTSRHLSRAAGQEVVCSRTPGRTLRGVRVVGRGVPILGESSDFEGGPGGLGCPSCRVRVTIVLFRGRVIEGLRPCPGTGTRGVRSR